MKKLAVHHSDRNFLDRRAPHAGFQQLLKPGNLTRIEMKFERLHGLFR